MILNSKVNLRLVTSGLISNDCLRSAIRNIFIMSFLSSVCLLSAYAAPSDSKSKAQDKVQSKIDQTTEAKKAPEKVEKKIVERLSKKEKEALSEEGQKIKKAWETRSSRFLSEATNKRHLRAQQNLLAKNYDQAINILEKVVNRSSSTKYEVAKTKVLISKAYIAQEKLDLAELNVQQAITLDQLSYQESTDAMLQLAQIQLMAKNYLESKKTLLKYIEIAPTSSVALVMMSAVDFQLENYKEAQEAIDKAMTMTKKPQEPWIYLAANAHYKNQSYKTSEKYFRDLIALRQTNKSYWLSLVAVLFEQNKTEEALTHYEMAHKLGHIKQESEIITRVGLMQASEIPFKAAKELEQALQNKKVKEQKTTYESLAGYWFASKDFDKAVAAYEKASRFSEDGKVDLMLGQVYLEMENWSQAQKSFSLALKKGNLKTQTGNAYMGLGLASFFKDEKPKALQYFSKAKDFKNQKDTAEKWIGFLN
jgi:tetratricopeptide (TPR) repeat protein